MFQLAGLLHERGFAVTVFHARFNAPDPSRHLAYGFVLVPDGLPAGTPETVAATMEHIMAVNTSCEAPFRERLAAPAGRSRRQGRGCVPGRRRAPAGPRARGAAAGRADAGAAHRQRHLLPQLPGQPRALREGVPPGGGGVEAGRAGEGAAAVPHPGPDGRQQQEPPRARAHVRAAVPGGRGGAELRRVRPQHLRRAGGGRLGGDPARPRRRARVRRRPAPQALPGVVQQPSLAGPLLPALAGRAGTGVRALHQLRQPGEHERRRPGRGGVGRGKQRAAVPVGAPAGARPRAALPDGFAAATGGRGLVVGWAPQEEVLAHGAVGGFWTHGGWNSAMEGACGGVPMLCRPCFGDQMGNARHVEHVWRAGIALDGSVLERGAVEAAVRRLMRGEEGEGMRGRARELRSRAAAAVADGGSSRVCVDKLVNHILWL
uniref:Glycosyltransferase n=1 Tax=Hordeum vulgare subsp. vulgare TaxID=112509 RepID=A0A8I6Y8H7_HORVV